MPEPTDFQDLLSQVHLRLEDLARASGSCVEEVQSWIGGAEIPQLEGKRLAQLGMLVSCLVQMMPPGEVRGWLYQEMHGPEQVHALQAISKEQGQQILERLQGMSLEDKS